MAKTVELDFGAGYVDYSAYLAGQYPITRRRDIYNELRPNVNTARFAFLRNSDVVNAFLTASEDVAVRIKEGADPFFLGWIRPTVKATIKADYGLEAFELEAVDAWYALDRAVAASAIYTNIQVCKPSDKSNSLLHQLFYGAGVDDAALSLEEITATVPALTVTAGADNYRQLIEGILSEAGYSAMVSPAGVIELYDLAPTTITPAATLATGVGGNISTGYTLERKEATAEAVEVEYHTIKTLTGAVVFEDSTGGGNGLDATIPVAAGEYYPLGAASGVSVKAEMKVADYKVLAVSNLALELSYTGAITTQAFTQEGNKIAMRFYSATGGVITKLRGRGDAVCEGDLRRVVRENVTNTQKREKIQFKYLNDEASAQRVARLRALRHSAGAFRWSIITTELTLEPGDYVSLDEAAVLGATSMLRVVSVVDGNDPKTVRIECEGVAAYTATSTTTEPELDTPPPPNPSTEAQIENIVIYKAQPLIEQYAPKYLGKYDHAHPSSYNPGDWWTVYDTDDSPIQRGVWWSNDGTPERITTASAVALRAKLAEAMPDVAWAEAQTTYGTSTDYGIADLYEELAAVNALITTLVAKQAFIDSLFAQSITVPDGGSIRFYNGEGVQRRAVQLAKDRVDWLDSPDGGDELPVARFGRLGVAGPVIFDGDLYSNYEAAWSEKEQVFYELSNDPSELSAIALADGTVVCFTSLSNGNKLYSFSKPYGGSWSTKTLVLNEVASWPSAVQCADGSIVCVFSISTGELYEISKPAGGSWSAKSVVLNEMVNHPNITQLSDGSLYCVFRLWSDYKLYAMSKPVGGSWSAKMLLLDENITYPSVMELSDGSMICLFASMPSQKLYEITKPAGGAWSAKSLVLDEAIYYPDAIQYIDGTVHCVFRLFADGSLQEMTKSVSGVWSSRSLVKSDNTSYVAEAQVYDGTCHCLFVSNSRLYESTRERYTRLGAGIVESGANANGTYIKYSDGTMHCWKKVSFTGGSYPPNGQAVVISNAMAATFVGDVAYSYAGRLFTSGGSEVYGYFATYNNSALFCSTGHRPQDIFPQWNTVGAYTATNGWYTVTAIGRWK